MPKLKEELASPQTVSANVTMFLAPLDPLDVLLRASRIVIEAVRSDPQVKEAAQAGLEWISRPIDPALLSTFKMVSRLGAQPETTLLSVMHLRVSEAVRTSQLGLKGIEDALKNSSQLLKTAKEGIARTDANFIGNLVVETEIRASRSTDFANKLAVAEKDAKSANELITRMVSLEGEGLASLVELLGISSLHLWQLLLVIVTFAAVSPGQVEGGDGALARP